MLTNDSHIVGTDEPVWLYKDCHQGRDIKIACSFQQSYGNFFSGNFYDTIIFLIQQFSVRKYIF
jgi:hypothetical protein